MTHTTISRQDIYSRIMTRIIADLAPGTGTLFCTRVWLPIVLVIAWNSVALFHAMTPL